MGICDVIASIKNGDGVSERRRRSPLKMTPDQVKAIRADYQMDQGEFARLLGADVRTVNRWELGTATPSGSSLAVLAGLREAINSSAVPGLIAQRCREWAAVGGVAYVLVRLMRNYFDADRD